MINTLNHAGIDSLNKQYNALDVYKRVEQLYQDFDAKDIMITSAFAATSAFLLKVFSDINKEQVVYFIDTGYHFKETLIYKEYLTKLYDLNVVSIQAEPIEYNFSKDNQLWNKNPNRCCYINKVKPLDHIKKDYKIWVSGLMKWQSDHRNSLQIFEQKETLLKFYPLLDIDYSQRDQFIKDHHLPFHPLKSKGYSSIGCFHCTVPGEDRRGRWNNSPKTECGLHL